MINFAVLILSVVVIVLTTVSVSIFARSRERIGASFFDSEIDYEAYGTENRGDGVIASPSICALADGRLVATNDTVNRFTTRIHESTDGGATWTMLAEEPASFWCTVFQHRGALYLFGTTEEYGNVKIARSDDGGRTWKHAVLLKGRWHRAPTPVVESGGRLWACVERFMGNWASGFEACNMSVPVSADLMVASSWLVATPLPFPSGPAMFLWGFGAEGWLEGNPVTGPGGVMFNILRVHRMSGGTAAVLRMEPHGSRFMGFVDFPGGSKKFVVRYDDRTKRYWTVTSCLRPDHTTIKCA